jgi:hypothetical protein
MVYKSPSKILRDVKRITKVQFLQILNELKPEQEKSHDMLKQERAQDLAKLEQELENLFKGQNQHHQWPQ